MLQGYYLEQLKSVIDKVCDGSEIENLNEKQIRQRNAICKFLGADASKEVETEITKGSKWDAVRGCKTKVLRVLFYGNGKSDVNYANLDDFEPTDDNYLWENDMEGFTERYRKLMKRLFPEYMIDLTNHIIEEENSRAQENIAKKLKEIASNCDDDGDLKV